MQLLLKIHFLLKHDLLLLSCYHLAHDSAGVYRISQREDINFEASKFVCLYVTRFTHCMFCPPHDSSVCLSLAEIPFFTKNVSYLADKVVKMSMVTHVSK